MIVKTVSSYIVYTCVNGAWVSGRAYATLLDKTTGKVVGNYTKIVDKQGELGTWAVLNSIGDAEESGDSASVVTGRTVLHQLQKFCIMHCLGMCDSIRNSLRKAQNYRASLHNGLVLTV